MKIKKAPVSDLIAYFIELYNKDITGTEYTSIPDIISSYYQKIAGSRIPIYEKILIEDWCFSSWGEIEDMPWTEGVLVKNKNGDFGITCYTGARDMGRANYDEYDLLYVYFLDHNILSREYFHPEDWEFYGIMTEYFLYKNINVGRIASEIITSQYTQKRLSAKHLLETMIDEIFWTDGFYDLFEIDVNMIKLNHELFEKGKSMDGWELKLNIDSIELVSKWTAIVNPSFK